MRYRTNQDRSLPGRWLKLLFDLADGVLRQDDQRLVFQEKHRHYPHSEKIKAEEILAQILIALNQLYPQLEARVNTETLLPQLQELKTAVEMAANDPERAEGFIAVNVKILLDDFDYMIKKASGDLDVKMPKGGFLKRRVYNDLRHPSDR